MDVPCRWVALLALVAATAACSGGAKLDGDVIRRAVDPASHVAATATRSDRGGATAPFVYHLYLRGSRDRAPHEILRATRVRAIDLSWSSPRHLTVRLTCGDVYQFTNFDDEIDRSGQDFGRTYVTLDVSRTCDEPAAAIGTPAAPASAGGRTQ